MTINIGKMKEKQEIVTDYDKTIEKIIPIFNNKNLKFSLGVLEEVGKRLTKKAIVKTPKTKEQAFLELQEIALSLGLVPMNFSR